MQVDGGSRPFDRADASSIYTCVGLIIVKNRAAVEDKEDQNRTISSRVC